MGRRPRRGDCGQAPPGWSSGTARSAPAPTPPATAGTLIGVQSDAGWRTRRATSSRIPNRRRPPAGDEPGRWNIALCDASVAARTVRWNLAELDARPDRTRPRGPDQHAGGASHPHFAALLVGATSRPKRRGAALPLRSRSTTSTPPWDRCPRSGHARRRCCARPGSIRTRSAPRSHGRRVAGTPPRPIELAP
jgi:hypothetical protein